MVRSVLTAILLLASVATQAAAQEAAVERAASPAATGPETLALPPMADPFAKTGDLDAGVRLVTPTRGAVIGGVIGGVAGALFGAYYAYAACDAAECHAISSDTWKAGLFFGVIGAAGGAAVGALFGWVDED